MPGIRMIACRRYRAIFVVSSMFRPKKFRPKKRSRTERNNPMLTELQAATPLQPPLAEWLEALSHDGPFEREDASILDEPAPRLALAPVLISLLKDHDPNVRIRVITALGNLGAQAHRVLPVLRAALKD